MIYDFYCDWSSKGGIGIVCKHDGKGIFYKRIPSQYNDHKMSKWGELEAINAVLDIVEGLGLNSVILRTDHLEFVRYNRTKRLKITNKNRTMAEFIQETDSRLEGLGVQIKFCRSHNNVPLNQAADAIAKSGENIEERLLSNHNFSTYARNMWANTVPPERHILDVFSMVEAWLINLSYKVNLC